MKEMVGSVQAAALDRQEAELLLRRLEEYRVRNSLSKKQLAARLVIPYPTMKKWFFEGDKARKPSKSGAERIRTFLEMSEAEHRAEIIRGLLLALEDQLRWFIDTKHTRGREVFRQSLSQYDVGYVSSLLTMLSEEEKFRRWLQFSTYSFQGFKDR